MCTLGVLWSWQIDMVGSSSRPEFFHPVLHLSNLAQFLLYSGSVLAGLGDPHQRSSSSPLCLTKRFLDERLTRTSRHSPLRSISQQKWERRASWGGWRSGPSGLPGGGDPWVLEGKMLWEGGGGAGRGLESEGQMQAFQNVWAVGDPRNQ